jgi:hypothetical protein
MAATAPSSEFTLELDPVGRQVPFTSVAELYFLSYTFSSAQSLVQRHSAFGYLEHVAKIFFDLPTPVLQACKAKITKGTLRVKKSYEDSVADGWVVSLREPRLTMQASA